MAASPAEPVERLRAICLALPEAAEIEIWGGPTFRVRGKIFAMPRIFVMSPEQEGRAAFWCKAPAGSQTILVGSDPERFFVPSYVGPKGWVGMRLDRDLDWGEVAALVARSYRLIAPKRLAALAHG